MHSKSDSANGALASNIDNIELKHPAGHEDYSVVSKPARRLSLSSQEDDPPWFAVHFTATKGMAVFAARKIASGTCVLSKKPMILLSDGDEKNPQCVQELFEHLSKYERKAYLKLYDAEKSDMSKVDSIYYSNCYNRAGRAKSVGRVGGSCIGLTASRFNHSCVPNLQFSFNEGTGCMDFYAIRPIPRGREMTTNYNTIYETSTNRQQTQMMYYGFRCDCEACEPRTEFWRKSNERRKAMIDAKRSLAALEKNYQAAATSVGNEALAALQSLEGLLIKEGLFGAPIADIYRSMAKWAERDTDMRATKQWKMKELETCDGCFGPESARSTEARRKLADISVLSP